MSIFSSRKKNLIIVGISILVAAISGIWWLQITMEQNRKSLLQGFIKENLPEVSQPTSLDIKKTTDPTGQTLYVANWTANNLTFHASLFYNDGSSNLMLSLLIPGIIENLNEATALSLTGGFFKKLGENWRCDKGEISEACESFWMDGKDKRCTSVQNLLPTGKSRLYTCRIPFGSENYNQDWCVPVQ